MIDKECFPFSVEPHFSELDYSFPTEATGEVNPLSDPCAWPLLAFSREQMPYGGWAHGPTLTEHQKMRDSFERSEKLRQARKNERRQEKLLQKSVRAGQKKLKTFIPQSKKVPTLFTVD